MKIYVCSVCEAGGGGRERERWGEGTCVVLALAQGALIMEDCDCGSHVHTPSSPRHQHAMDS